jgi:hypothetical protein
LCYYTTQILKRTDDFYIFQNNLKTVHIKRTRKDNEHENEEKKARRGAARRLCGRITAGKRRGSA